MSGISSRAPKKKRFQVLSALVARAKAFQQVGFQFGDSRDIYAALGYKRTINYTELDQRYERQDIAGRIVDAYPSSTWEKPPIVKEDDDPEKQTAFETAWESLVKKRKVYHFLERVDRLAGIGQYAVLLIGAKGDLEQPLPQLDSQDGVLYLTPYAQNNASIIEVESDPANERFGLPLRYTLQPSSDLPNVKLESITKRIHWSRVIHVAEGLKEDEILGRSRLTRVLNLLDDLQKVVGGSAEMFWQGAYGGLQADVDKDMQLDPDDEEALSDEIDEYVHGVRRWIRTKGITLNSLTADIKDPRGAFSIIISLISGATGIPQRILTGSERGQLASEQDVRNWNARVRERQESFAGPCILVPFIDRLISVGALPEVEYEVEWPDLTALGEEAQSQVAERMGRAIKAQADSKETVVTNQEFRKDILKLPPDPPTPLREPEETPTPAPAPAPPIRAVGD